jgi:molybdopterin biosynthesis enzyme
MVRRIVNTGFLTAGEGLVVPGEDRGLEERFSPLGYMLMSLLSRAGAWPVDYGIAPGGDSVLKAVETGLKECPVFFVLGADAAQMRGFFSAPGREFLCDGVAVEGGEDLLFGRLMDGEGNSTGFLFSITSEPVLVFFLYHLFLRPFLFFLNGGAAPDCMLRCFLADGLERGNGSPTGLIPVRLSVEPEGGLLAVPIPVEGPEHVTALIGADGLALLPAGSQYYGPRTPVDVLLFR